MICYTYIALICTNIFLSCKYCSHLYCIALFTVIYYSDLHCIMYSMHYSIMYCIMYITHPTYHALRKTEAVLAEEVTVCGLLYADSVLRAGGASVDTS